VENHRLERATEAIREELGEMISYELRDPRVEAVEVLDVQLDPGKKRAVVSIQVPDSDAEGALEALTGARRYLQQQLIVRLEIRRIPELHFTAASSLGPKKRVESLLRRVRKGRPRVT
jgi:ribosome-binding factor A